MKIRLEFDTMESIDTEVRQLLDFMDIVQKHQQARGETPGQPIQYSNTPATPDKDVPRETSKGVYTLEPATRHEPDVKPDPEKIEIEELKARLTEMGVNFGPRARLATLKKLLADAEDKKIDEEMENSPDKPEPIPTDDELRAAGHEWLNWYTAHASCTKPEAKKVFEKLMRVNTLIGLAAEPKVANIIPEKKAAALKIFQGHHVPVEEKTEEDDI